MVGRTFLGRYEAIRLLGEGGMGRVYLARQIDLGRYVVVKVMHDHVATEPKFRDRFQRETLLMARFQHPYVVTLFDASLNDPQGPCIIMEYIRGVTVDTLLHRNGRLNPARIARLLNQLCEALQAAHTEGIIHRDLKPANLMVVDPDTPYEKIKIMDFGLAKLVENTAGLSRIGKVTDTGTDFAVGTPGYISPEQVRGEPITVAADVYALGLLLYKALKGRLVRERPYVGLVGIECAMPPLDRYSFPSGHTLHAVLFTTMAVQAAPVLALLLVPFTLLVAASRVVLGLHYPSDVLAGATLGFAIASVANTLA